MRVGIVGAGIAGCTAAAACRREGFEVTVIDDRRLGSGSAASGMLLKPSWLGAWLREDRESVNAGLELLDQLFGVKELTFRFGPRRFQLMHVDPRVALNVNPYRFLRGTALEAGEGRIRYRKPSGREVVEEFDQVLLATGAWKELFLLPELRTHFGAAHLFEGTLEEGVLVARTPYKQIMAFERFPGELWASDGTSVQRELNGRDLVEMRKRCMRALPGPRPYLRALVGARPYVKGRRFGAFRSLDDRTRVATGGHKMGMILAAIHARQFLRAVA